ncbi:hypothetical protein SAMN05421755_100269 [Nitrosomonas sp. Nm33]|nr:hypothetical protein SAMN05421755_100269 [Nitrosomonas sp. Nm33]
MTPQDIQFRFIPTPVGNREESRTNLLIRAVHPHARGEQHARTELVGGHAGSSPRPWGTAITCLDTFASSRFIPTPVGNRQQNQAVKEGQTVHPHARGEQGLWARSLLNHIGSSPRPWGTEIAASQDNHSIRFIPTPVGNRQVCKPA